MHAPNNRKSHLRDKPLNRREILRECHLANGEFRQELEIICKLLIAAGFFSYSGGLIYGLETDAEGKKVGEQGLREAVRLTEETLELLCHLIDKWPRAQWLFFPDDGYAGLVRFIRQFYTQTFSCIFPPGTPHRVHLKSHRVTGNRWCGEPERLRLAETTRALKMWKEFKDGRSPIEIARLEMTRPRGRRKSLHSAVVTVSRSLQRAHFLIYGKSLPNNRRERGLEGFDVATHMQHCRLCNSGTLCQAAKAYVNLDSVALREQPIDPGLIDRIPLN